MKRWFSLMLFLLLASSCNRGSFGDKSSTNNKSKGDDKPRPSEQGEGVVGYLVDPNQVRYTEDGGNTTVSGDPGSVEFAGQAQTYEACLQELSEESLSTIVDGGSAFSADVKGRGAVNADGSFSITMEGTPSGVLAVNVSGFCDSLPPAGFVGSGTSVVFRRPGEGGFETSDAFGTGDDTSDPLCVDVFNCVNSVQFRFFDAATKSELQAPVRIEFRSSSCEAGDAGCGDTKYLDEAVVVPLQKVGYGDENYVFIAYLKGYTASLFGISKEDVGQVRDISFEPLEEP